MADDPAIFSQEWTPRPDPTRLTTEQLRREIDALREVLSSEMRRIEDVHKEKFASIAAALEARRALAETQNRANAEAAEKTERSFTKEIDGLKTLIATTGKGTEDRILDLTRRLDRGEGSVVGAGGAHMAERSQREEWRMDLSLIVAIVAVVLSLAVGILNLTTHQSAPAAPTLVSPTVVPLERK